MRYGMIVVLLALTAGMSAGCATATRRDDGLASIRARPRNQPEAPPQRVLAPTSTGLPHADAPAPSGERGGLFARPDGLAKFFPGLLKDPAEAPKVVKTTAPRTPWLGRRLRSGLGQTTPTSLTYSTAPRPSGSGRATEPGEVSVLPVSLSIPIDHPRDHEVTPTTGDAPSLTDSPTPDAPGVEPLTPLAPANPESFSPPAPTVPDPEPTTPTIPEPAPITPTPDPIPQEPVPAPAVPEAKPEGPLTLPEPSTPEPKVPEPTPKPVVEPALIAPEVPAVETPKPTPPVVPAPAPSPSPPIVPSTDPRERPRLADPRPRARAVVVPQPEAKRDAPTPAPRSTVASAPTKTIPVATQDPAEQGRQRASIAEARSRDRAVLAVKTQVEATRALGLPDPTLPSSYYRQDAPPVRGDAPVLAKTTASAPAPALAHAHPTADPSVARVSGPCPHCGHDPNWRPSFQRLGRRLFGLGEFASPEP